MSVPPDIDELPVPLDQDDKGQMDDQEEIDIKKVKPEGSTKKQIGSNTKLPQINIDAVTFSFFLLLIFKVNNPPIT